MTEPNTSGDDYRELAIAALDAGDWQTAYQWAKGWIGRGGGAWIVDPWLIYVASALLHRQPRSAVHSADLALKHWIPEPTDRAILLWVRGDLVWRRLNDPRTALVDLADAERDAPVWLAGQAAADRQACESDASSSRMRKPAVGPAPAYVGRGTAADSVARSAPHVIGARPAVWEAVVSRLR